VLAAYALMELCEEHPEILEKVEVLWVDSGYDGDKFALAVWLMIQARVEVRHRTEPTHLRFYPSVGWLSELSDGSTTIIVSARIMNACRKSAKRLFML